MPGKPFSLLVSELRPDLGDLNTAMLRPSAARRVSDVFLFWRTTTENKLNVK